MTLTPLNVGFGADGGANRRGGLLDLLGGLEFEFLAGDHRLGGRVKFVGDVAQVVGVFANIVRRLGEVAGIAACGACRRVFYGFGQRDRILVRFSFRTKRCEYTKNTSEKRFTGGNSADYFAVKGICL